MSIAEKDAHITARYHSIAHDLETVVLDTKEKAVCPKNFTSELLCRVYTGILMLSIARYESGGFREDVDKPTGTGDHGKAHCLMQIQLRDGEEITDRQSCFRLGLARIRESIKACSELRSEDRLVAYASGNCNNDTGIKDSRLKVRQTNNWLKNYPFMMLGQGD